MLTATYITCYLIVLLAVVWLGAMAVVVGACTSAARGDRALVVKRASDSSARSAPAGMQLVA